MQQLTMMYPVYQMASQQPTTTTTTTTTTTATSTQQPTEEFQSGDVLGVEMLKEKQLFGQQQQQQQDDDNDSLDDQVARELLATSGGYTMSAAFNKVTGRFVTRPAGEDHWRAYVACCCVSIVTSNVG
jgi:hypothetical protein